MSVPPPSASGYSARANPVAFRASGWLGCDWCYVVFTDEAYASENFP